MTVDILAAKSIELFLGAGDVHLEHLIATSEVDIEGGTGQITIGNGALHDLTLKMGMGALHLNAALSGDNELEFGVGEADITVLGSKEDYRIDIQKGLGAISIDGQDASDFGSGGNGQNSIEIEGGVGAIRLTFREE